MQVAALLADFADARLFAFFFTRSINAMQALSEPPPAVDYIAPVYNLGEAYRASGATRERNQLMGQLVELVRGVDTVPVEAMRALLTLLPEFEQAGYAEAAVVLHLPVYRTVTGSPSLAWDTRLATIARMGRLYLANGQSEEAVRIYEQALGHAQARGSSAPDAATAPMTLWYLIAEAKGRGGDRAGEMHAYETARALAEAGSDPDSGAAGAIYHNLAGCCLRNGMRDRYEEAESLTRRALAIEERSAGRNTSAYAGGLGQIANLRAGMGRHDEAQDDYDACFAAFEAAEDSRPSDIADFREDEGKSRLEAGQPERAAESFAVAREIRAGLQGLARDRLADSDAWVGIAHFESGNFAEAVRMFRGALALRMAQPPQAA
jgi:tetratricopeptide (TPR) repeat protein